MSRADDIPDRSLIANHRRQWRGCLYVYPVVSRRSEGLSIGVNLNPNRACTFSCVYCQIDRNRARGLQAVDMDILRAELAAVLDEAVSGELWTEPRFAETPPHLRRLNDIALSGDGEPTCLDRFDEAVRVAAAEKDRRGLDEVKLVVITNSSRLESPQVERALPVLDAANGEIWAKLDAGTDAYFQEVARPSEQIRLDEIIRGITHVARGRPVVIQTLWMRLRGEPPAADEIEAYAGRLREILSSGGRIHRVQMHTIARSPAEPFVSYLKEEQLNTIADRVRSALPELEIKVYPGRDVSPQG